MPQGISRKKPKQARGALKVPPFAPQGRGFGESFEAFKKRKELIKKMPVRGEKPARVRQPQTPPEGVPTEGAVMMEHPGKGKRYIPKMLVEKKQKWGWKLLGGRPAKEEPKEVEKEKPTEAKKK